MVGMKAVTNEDDLVLMTQGGILLRTSASDLRAIGRATQGVLLINLKEGDRLISIERVVKEEDNGESLADGEGTEGGATNDTAAGGTTEEGDGEGEHPGSGQEP